MREARAPAPTDDDGSAPPATIGEAELTALALAADPDQPLDPEAVPLDTRMGQAFEQLPAWYMPPVTARRCGRARRLVILAVVGAFLVIEACGLCSTYGQLPFH